MHHSLQFITLLDVLMPGRELGNYNWKREPGYPGLVFSAHISRTGNKYLYADIVEVGIMRFALGNGDNFMLGEPFESNEIDAGLANLTQGMQIFKLLRADKDWLPPTAVNAALRRHGWTFRKKYLTLTLTNEVVT